MRQHRSEQRVAKLLPIVTLQDGHSLGFIRHIIPSFGLLVLKRQDVRTGGFGILRVCQLNTIRPVSAAIYDILATIEANEKFRVADKGLVADKLLQVSLISKPTNQRRIGHSVGITGTRAQAGCGNPQNGELPQQT